MGRNKIKIEYIQSISNRRVTFRKRWLGLQKKAKQLSILSGCDLLMILKPYDAHNDSTHKFIELSSKQPTQSLLQEYMEAKYHGQVQVLDFEDIQEEDDEAVKYEYQPHQNKSCPPPHLHPHPDPNPSLSVSHYPNNTHHQQSPSVYEPSIQLHLPPPPPPPPPPQPQSMLSSSPPVVSLQSPRILSSLPLVLPEKSKVEEPHPYQETTSPHIFFPNSTAPTLHTPPFPPPSTSYSSTDQPYAHVLSDYPIFFPPGSSNNYYE